MDLMINYLETKPKEEFIKSEIERLQKRIDRINNEYSEWLTNASFEVNNMKNPRFFYENKMELSKYKEQLQNLKYLLDE